MKYYLPTLLKKLGLSTRLALLAGGIEVRLIPQPLRLPHNGEGKNNSLKIF